MLSLESRESIWRAVCDHRPVTPGGETQGVFEERH